MLVSLVMGSNNPNRILQQHQDETLKEIEIEYDDSHNIIRTEVAGIVTEFFYDCPQGGDTTFGVITGVISTADDFSTSESMTYTEDFNFLESYTDSRGMTSWFVYDEDTGQILTATDPNGNTVTYEYDEITGRLTSITGQADVNEPETVTGFDYAQGLLEAITRGGGILYELGRDEIGRISEVMAGGVALASNSYDARQRLSQQNYANNDSYEIIYDRKDRIIGEIYVNANSSQQSFSYAYNLKNQLSRLVDSENGVTWSYGYDVSGRLATLTGSDGTQARFDFNTKTDRLSRLTVSQNGVILADVSYEYADDGRPVEAILHSMDASLSYGFDPLNRLQHTYLGAGGFSLEQSFSYAGEEYSATGLVEQLQSQVWGRNGFDILQDLTYTYDDLGNITTITGADEKVIQYRYDGLNRLVREDNEHLGHSFQYTFDAGGNLTLVTLHGFSLGALGPVLESNVYEYENDWPDQLSSHNGNAITYDGMGNPLAYKGLSFEWQRGRQLAGVEGLGLSTSYKYNAEGLRTQKIVNGVTTDYTWINGLLMRQCDGVDSFDFAYDATGRAIGFNLNGESFFYIHNLQGDVAAIIDADGDVVARYEYDAWGNILHIEGPMADSNPIRYRGYYWDEEIGMYYLQSRYYNPAWGRFLNADRHLIAGNALTATNLYAYTNGNPVMLVDPDGELAKLFRAVVNVGTAVVQFACDLVVAGATAAVSVVTGQATVIEAGKQFVSDVKAATETLVTSIGQSIEIVLEEVTSRATSAPSNSQNSHPTYRDTELTVGHYITFILLASTAPLVYMNLYGIPEFSALAWTFNRLIPGLIRHMGSFWDAVDYIYEEIWLDFVSGGITAADLPRLRRILDDEVFMLAAVTFGEVGMDIYPVDEWIAVAHSIRNRVEDRRPFGGWANNYADVISQTSSTGVKQYDAFESNVNLKYKRSMNYMTGRTMYPGLSNPSNADITIILECLRIAIGIYFRVYYSDTSNGAYWFWQSARKPDWANARANTPRAILENPPGPWRHTFWV